MNDYILAFEVAMSLALLWALPSRRKARRTARQALQAATWAKRPDLALEANNLLSALS